MVRFSKLTLDESGKPKETDVRDIPQEAIRQCPHYIFAPEHYRRLAPYNCKCDDPNHTVMVSWGYKWDTATKRWS